MNGRVGRPPGGERPAPALSWRGEVDERAGRMPAPQRARRPRYVGRVGFHFQVAQPLQFALALCS